LPGSKVVAAKRGKRGYVERYDSLDAECGAYVNAQLSASYPNSPATADYFPSVVMNVRIVKRKSNEIVYEETVAYGFVFQKAGTPMQITAEPQFRFKDFAAMMADVPLAGEGLHAGIPKVTEQLERDLQQ
jgi:hypothetical protein